ncbi:MAG: ABC transporter ATP-binding protein [Deltaproteobacteria bacterium]|nr:ABC transporter ATP-binding protein [Deltaproteobacteria bacterium]MBI3293920.1 ABC transporter ATP-binding protein [Deltaproteobacteria bacterium]
MIIRAERLGYSFKNLKALDGVSFSVNEAERYAILGPNGSGKSTLLKILSTLNRPQEGEITFFDGQPVSLVETRRQVGVVFQSPALDKKLTVRENIRCYARLYGIIPREIDRRLSPLEQDLDLTEVLDRRVENLSGGYQRRAELAKVLITDPRLLILDEPTTGLDPLAREEFWALLRRLQDSRRLTLVFSTHHFDEAMLATRVLMLARGKAVAEGSRAELAKDLGEDLMRVDVKTPEPLAIHLSLAYGLRPLTLSGRVYADVSSQKGRLPEIYGDVMARAERVTIGRPELSDIYFIKTGASEMDVTP